ncbi:MAG: CDP-glycerol glycerophosphotransferase family protein [Coriobacteriales bacterium]|nr:CDP-glycerol glycerophosphotransferase family protein [Coriobacteriales bacterium]
MKRNPKYLIPTGVRDVFRRALTDFMFDYGHPLQYRRAARQPVDPKRCVFIEMDRDAVSDSMQLVYDEMQRRGFTCDFISLHMHCGSFVEYTRRSGEMAKMVATAKYVFICEAQGRLACLPLRPETKVIQLWHGCGAFKKFGMSTADKIFGGTREEKMRRPAHRNTSLVTVSSPEVVWAYEEAMSLEGTGIVQPLGVSRTDVFFDQDFIERCRREVEEVVPETKGRQVVLYAPTFRGRVATAEAPDQLDINLLHERLGEDWILLIKHHPHIKKRPPVPAGCERFAFDVTDKLSIEACLCRSDACVSDYSSLVFEYSLFGRPMAFFAYDLADYDDWRGFYYDYDELTPGPIFATTHELAEWVEHLDERFDPIEVAAFREKFMGACDGHATERIIKTVLGE